MDRASAGLALFPASFDPVTNGHLDLVHRARRVFPELMVGVAHNVAKSGTFPVEERVEMLESALGDLPGVRVTSFQGLMVVVEDGLEAGEMLVVRGHRDLRDGSLVAVTEVAAAPDGSLATDPAAVTAAGAGTRVGGATEGPR